jgi:hypothetical protein
MAKGQKRGNKEAKKPKSTDKKPAGPKYMAAVSISQPLGATSSKRNKRG